MFHLQKSACPSSSSSTVGPSSLRRQEIALSSRFSNTILHSTALQETALTCTALNCTTPHRAALHRTALYNTIIYSTAQCTSSLMFKAIINQMRWPPKEFLQLGGFKVLNCTVQYCISNYCIVFQCISLYFIVFQNCSLHSTLSSDVLKRNKRWRWIMNLWTPYDKSYIWDHNPVNCKRKN